ncbi:hypothetical protein B9Z19DRAFT_1068721 [Tuber borchii]|uniref:Uncharacterized protein n=1 Tax=Tuber borchii TaxID=42251 RepID=A0A2T6ZE67_TUBBO|nr:hypothetical protein B9Z19DRAFT_1068721 [Tuber borchii]
MPSNDADILREQVLRSQKIATIKRNIEVLSNNVIRLQGQDSPEDLPPARAQAIAGLNGKIATLEIKAGGKQGGSWAKTPIGKAPTAETHLEADKTACHMSETIADSQLDRPKGKEALEEHCEAISEAKLARKKKMADLEAEVRVLSKIFERISAEMLELREKGNGPKETSEAWEIPTTQIPLGAEGAVSHPDDTAAKKRILKRLLLNPNTAQAIPTQVNKISSEAPVEIKNTASHANKTTPGGRILEPPQPEPDNALAIPTLASRDADILAKTHEHKLREQIRKMTAERIEAVEQSKCNFQEEKPAGKAPTTKTTEQRTKEEEKNESNIQEPKPTSKVPNTEAPLEVENAASHTNNTSPEEGIIQPPHRGPDSAESMLARTSKSENHTAAIHEHELKGQVTKMTVEGAKAAEKSESSAQEKEPISKVPTTEVSLEVEIATSHSNETTEQKRIPECPQRDPDGAEAIAARASQNAEILARIHQLALKRQIEKMTDALKKAAEKTRAGVLKKIHPGKDLHGKRSLEAHAGPSDTHQTALKKKPLKQLQPPSVNAQALAEYESKVGDLKAQLHKYELKRHMEKVVDMGTNSAVIKPAATKPVDTKPGGVGTEGGKSTGIRSEGTEPEETKPEGFKFAGNIGKDLTQTPVGTALGAKTPMAPRKKRPEHLQPDSTKAQAIAAHESKIRNFKAILQEHELKQKIKKQRAEQRAKALANRINDEETKKTPGNSSTAGTQLGAGKAVSHADEIRSRKRKAEEDQEVIPDNVKKQRYTPKPKLQEENLGERKRIGTAELKVEKSGRTSATEYAEKALGGAEPAPIRNDTAAKAPLETEKVVPHANETCSKKRKAEEEHETIPESKKPRYRYLPKLKAQEETPPKRKHIKTAEREIESPEYISIAEYNEQDKEETRSEAAEQGKAEQENPEQANPVDEGTPEVPQRSVEVGTVRETQAAAPREFVPFTHVPDPFVDEVDYEID